jgi:hypothetical protein
MRDRRRPPADAADVTSNGSVLRVNYGGAAGMPITI